MYRKILVVMLAVLALVVIQVVTAPAQTAKETAAAKPAVAKVMPHRVLANEVAVCGCGKIFVPNAQTKTFTYEGKEYACCSEECHKKLTSMSPAEAAKICDDQVKKLETPAPAETSPKK